jgi:glucosamine-6-phosphate deaminase
MRIGSPSRDAIVSPVAGGALSEPEKIPIVIMEDHDALSLAIARRIAGLIRVKADEGSTAVLGLATGSTPLGVYRELVRMHREEGLDFSNVVTFNLDEYFPIEPGRVQSYWRFMRTHLFDHVNVPQEQIHIPRGDLPREEVEQECAAYEQTIRRAGGIDFQILGIGRSGHVGFNEPGSSKMSRTRLLYLDPVTRADAASDFFGEENVPLQAITMGVATILEAREIALIATGEHKAKVVQRAVEGPIHPDVAATFLQEHAGATVYLDPAAAAELTRVRTPWVLGAQPWSPERELEAVLWLSEVTGKPILHLSTNDYREHHLSGLAARYGAAGPLNGRAFNTLIAKIRGKSKLPREERVLVFSPHPDDDVISMGGALRKLVENGNEVTVAYQTSGNIAVFDDEVRRYLAFATQAAKVLGLDAGGTFRALAERVQAAFDEKEPGEVDGVEVQALKKLIRETEAVAALEAVGLGRANARFLDMPFYRTGAVEKAPISEDDIHVVSAVLENVNPTIVFAAGDLTDPHGTHRMCLQAVERALERYAGPPPQVWLYRGAWQEWPISEATVLVPLSEHELRRKILAIFRHQSQKDVAPFPGPDPREFWQRVETRNRETADRLRRLGLPAYYAMEAYQIFREGRLLSADHVPTAHLATTP